MSELKSIRVLNFSGRTTDLEGCSEKFLARSKRRGYKRLLIGKDTVPTAEEYENAVAKNDRSGDNIIKLNDANEEAFEDIILSIDHTSKQGKVAFSLVKNCKTAKYPEGNCKLAWDRLVAKYSPKTAPSLLKLKKNFANSQLESVDKHPDEWMTELESLRNEIDKISVSTKMSDEDFMIHVLNNLTEDYDVVLDGMESRLMLNENDPNKLTIEDVRDKLSGRFDRIRERSEKEKDSSWVTEEALAAYTKQYKGICGKCGEYGHHSRICPQNEPNGFKFQPKRGNYKPEAACYYCGEKGHYMRDCQVKKKAELLKMSEAKEFGKFAVDEEQYESTDDESIKEIGF